MSPNHKKVSKGDEISFERLILQSKSSSMWCSCLNGIMLRLSLIGILKFGIECAALFGKAFKGWLTKQIISCGDHHNDGSIRGANFSGSLC